jgi:glucose/arabinose dehydrogenase
MDDEFRSDMWSVAVGVAVALVIVFVIVGVILLTLILGVFPTAPSADAGAIVEVVVESTLVPVLSHAAPPPPDSYTWELVAADFDSPLYMTVPADGTDRLFVVEQTGSIWVVEDGATRSQPFLNVTDDLPAEVLRGGYTERGLLGLAFAPDFVTSGTFYISYVNSQNTSVIERIRVSADDPNLADVSSRQVILQQSQPAPDHNGGDIGFGPDGYLYIGFGDGGSLEDPNRTGQNPGTWLGKLLRIDVSTEPYTIPVDNPHIGDSTYLPEIYASGLRNPWRWSFDRVTGDLYIGDVGQAQREEISFMAAGDSGLNFGWSAFEGTVPLYEQSVLGEVAPPVAEYPHEQGCSVTGGYVYRGAALPALNGYYIAGDYCTGRIWYVYRDEAGAWQFGLWMDTEFIISSFGEDADGEQLYLVDYKGGLYRLVAAPS